MKVTENKVDLSILKCFQNKIMLIYANLCELSQSSQLNQEVVLTCPVLTCIWMTIMIHTCLSYQKKSENRTLNLFTVTQWNIPIFIFITFNNNYYRFPPWKAWNYACISSNNVGNIIWFLPRLAFPGKICPC